MAHAVLLVLAAIGAVTVARTIARWWHNERVLWRQARRTQRRGDPGE